MSPFTAAALREVLRSAATAQQRSANALLAAASAVGTRAQDATLRHVADTLHIADDGLVAAARALTELAGG